MTKTTSNSNVEIDNLPTQANKRGDDSEARVTNAIDQYSARMTPAIFNRKENKLVQQHVVNELSQGFEHRRRSLNMALETRLHSIREACNHVLVTGKTHLRQQRLEYFGEVYKQVEQKMNQLSDTFLTDMDERFSRIEKYNNQKIREKEEKRLDKSVDDFLNTLDQLMEEFRSIISESIDHKEGITYEA